MLSRAAWRIAVADFAFDEGGDEQREELAAEQCLDPCWVVQQQGCGVLDGLEQVVAAFQVRLVAVGAEDLGVGQVAVVADQREAAVAGGVVGDLVQGDVGVHAEAAGEDLLGSGSRLRAGRRVPACTPWWWSR